MYMLTHPDCLVNDMNGNLIRFLLKLVSKYIPAITAKVAILSTGDGSKPDVIDTPLLFCGNVRNYNSTHNA